MSDPTVAEVLECAARHIERDGLRQDGLFGTVDGPCCVVGAMARAAGGHVALDKIGARDALVSYLKVPSVIAWNDAPGRTASEVIEARMAGECLCGAWSEDRPDARNIEVDGVVHNEHAVRSFIAERNLLRTERDRLAARLTDAAALIHRQELAISDQSRKLATWKTIAERDHGAPIETVDALTAERDAAIARAEKAEQERDEANLYATRMDKTVDVIRDSNRTIEGDTAEAIAAWLEQTARDSTKHGAFIMSLAFDIRAGAYRKESSK